MKIQFLLVCFQQLDFGFAILVTNFSLPMLSTSMTIVKTIKAIEASPLLNNSVSISPTIHENPSTLNFSNSIIIIAKPDESLFDSDVTLESISYALKRRIRVWQLKYTRDSGLYYIVLVLQYFGEFKYKRPNRECLICVYENKTATYHLFETNFNLTSNI
jgi:hypothetical protein